MNFIVDFTSDAFLSGWFTCCIVSFLVDISIFARLYIGEKMTERKREDEEK